MDLESEFPVLVDNGESVVHNNGSCEVENNNDSNELHSDAKGKETEGSAVSSTPVETKTEVYPSPKGYGLKKWRRVRRDASRGGDSSSFDTGNMAIHELSESVANPSKRSQIYAERPQKSEGSVTSTNPVVGSLDVLAFLGHSTRGKSVDAGTDSENSEDRSSKSSTAASVPRMKHEIPVLVGFTQDKSRMRNLNHSGQRGQQGKGRIEPIKKARGERVKIEKENSRSSMESDSRSSNFVFTQGTYSKSNGIRSERSVHHDKENGHEFQRSKHQVSDGPLGCYGRDGEGGYEDISPEDLVANLSWEVKKERSENHASSSDHDPLVESINILRNAQAALEKEVQKFKEISIDASVDDSVSDTHPDYGDVEQKLQETSSEIANRDVERELEDLFKQRIEAEVEYLAISRMVQTLRATPLDQTTILETLGKLSENKDAMVKKEGAELENSCEDIASGDEMLRIQNRVCKHTSYFIVQLFLFLVVVGVFTFQLTPNYGEVVPT